MKKKLSFIYFIFFLVNTSQGQMAMDTIELPEVELKESRVTVHDIGMQINSIKTTSLSEGSSIDLASLITASSSVYIKEYGALATPTFRGTSSSHTLVLWNGVPVNSIANGLSDLSAIYCHSFSDILLTHGGSSSVFGSGAVGGSLHLNTNAKLSEENKLLLSFSEGSYGFSSQAVRFSINHGKLTSKGGMFFLNHKNNFEYINSTQSGSPLSVNEYGNIKSEGQDFNLLYKLNKYTNYNFSFWGSNLEREVSQSMSVPVSDAKQYDISKRFLFSFKHKLNILTIELKQAYIQEDFRYTELLKNINSYYTADSYISDADIKLLKGNYLINIGSAFTNNKINNNNYSLLHKEEKTFATFSAIQYKSIYFSFNSVLRKEWQSDFEVPLIPMIALEGRFSDKLNIRAKYNRNFRSPTFNDRFWIGASARGNIDLKPEDAFNKEFGIDFNFKNFKFDVTVYNLHISDMILWQQMDNGNWMPNNIKAVFSRGIESVIKFKYKNFRFDGNYAFTKSTSEVATNSLDQTVGQQLRYVPLHKGGASITIIEDNLKFRLDKAYTGEVITSYGAPNNKTLDSFVLTNFSITYMFKSTPVYFHAKVKNLMDKSYVTYQNYPNPGREYLFTIEYIIK